MKKKAIILGVTGQDGSYMAELLLKKIIAFMEFIESQRPLIQEILTIF